jgi:hypothetical protein
LPFGARPTLPAGSDGSGSASTHSQRSARDRRRRSNSIRCSSGGRVRAAREQLPSAAIDSVAPPLDAAAAPGAGHERAAPSLQHLARERRERRRSAGRSSRQGRRAAVSRRRARLRAAAAAVGTGRNGSSARLLSGTCE